MLVVLLAGLRSVLDAAACSRCNASRLWTFTTRKLPLPHYRRHGSAILARPKSVSAHSGLVSFLIRVLQVQRAAHCAPLKGAGARQGGKAGRTGIRLDRRRCPVMMAVGG